MNAFAQRPAKLLLKDKRFKDVMKEITPRSGYHYGDDMSLSEAISGVLDTATEPVTILDGRYALVPSGVGAILSGRGLVWIDLNQGEVLGVFFFRPTNGEPTPSLTVYSRQLTGTQLSMRELPAAFAEDLDLWAVSAGVPLLCAQYFIPQKRQQIRADARSGLLHAHLGPDPAPGAPVLPADGGGRRR